MKLFGGAIKNGSKNSLKTYRGKKAPFYRIVVADARAPRDGRSIETIGTFNPLTTPEEVKIDEEKALAWLANGAKPSDTVRNLFSSQGIMEKFHNSKISK